MDQPTPIARIGIRLLALALMTWGMWQWLANSAESLWDFDPNYLSHFLSLTALRPALACIVGLALWLGAPALSKRM